MKSIQNQYNQLIEGNISRANFMRNIRMTFPQYITNVTSFDDSVKILKNKGILSEAKKEQEYQCNPVELAMGIKVEMEHTDDPKKAEKIAMDHLKENPSYYSELKLSGIDSHQEAPTKKAKSSKAPKDGELVDKENGMKVVKEGQEGELEEVGLNMMSNEEPNEAVKQAAQFLDLNNTLKPFSGDITLQNGGVNDAILQYGYWEQLPEGVLEKLSLQFDIEQDVEEHGDEKRPTIAYILTPKNTSYSKTVDLGAAFEKFKSKLEEIVREVVNEEFNK